MSEPDLKEYCRIFYIVKGHLRASEETIKSSYNGYFKRIWYDEETYYKTEGFEEAWIEYQNNVSYSKEK